MKAYSQMHLEMEKLNQNQSDCQVDCHVNWESPLLMLLASLWMSTGHSLKRHGKLQTKNTRAVQKVWNLAPWLAKYHHRSRQRTRQVMGIGFHRGFTQTISCSSVTLRAFSVNKNSSSIFKRRGEAETFVARRRETHGWEGWWFPSYYLFGCPLVTYWLSG